MSRNFETITICGSTKFKREILIARKELTLKGWIVLSPEIFGHSGDVVTDDEKKLLDQMHKSKIDMSDAIYVVNVNNYIGESTKKEIFHAQDNGKSVLYQSKFNWENK